MSLQSALTVRAPALRRTALSGVAAPYVTDGAMDGPTFLAYAEQVLAPTLEKGDIVFMDNLRTHKVDGVRQAIEAVCQWCATPRRQLLCQEILGQICAPAHQARHRAQSASGSPARLCRSCR
jgi:hypothetical protein